MNLRGVTKSAIFEVGRYTGINFVSRHIVKQKLIGLCYHGIVPQEHVAGSYLENDDAYLHRNAVSLSRFTAQMEFMGRHFHPVDVNAIVNWFDRATPLPSHPVLITFDDGFRNQLQFAAPVLTKLGIPALFNIPTGYIGGQRLLWPMEVDQLVLNWERETIPLPNSESREGISIPKAGRRLIAEQVRNQCKRLPDVERTAYLDQLRAMGATNGDSTNRDLIDFMSWDQIRELSKAGFDIGSHTVTHPILANLDANELQRELVDSKATLERELDRPCSVITYPNGQRNDVSREVTDAAEKAGYDIGFTLIEQFASQKTPKFEIGRFNVTADTSHARFESIVSGVYSLLKPGR